MVNKVLMLLLLCSTMAFGQLVKVDVNLDSIASIIDKKDKKLEMYMYILNHNEMVLEDCTNANIMLVKEIDSLKWFKLYYMHSKHVIGPRIIGRIEEMID